MPAVVSGCRPWISASSRMARPCTIHWCALGGTTPALRAAVRDAVAGFTSRSAASAPSQLPRPLNFHNFLTTGIRTRSSCEARRRKLAAVSCHATGTYLMTTQLVTVGHSPDPDDAFMFYALAHDKLDTGNLRFRHELQDIETLNRRALRGELEVTAISIHAY